MDNSKFLKTAIILLLIINLGTLSYLWIQKDGHRPPPPEIGNFLMHELNFINDQEKQFIQLRDEHRNMTGELKDRSRKLHDNFFNLLSENPADSAKVNLMADSMISIQKQIELSTFYHFQKVRAICTPEQQKRFDNIISDAMAMMAPRPPR